MSQGGSTELLIKVVTITACFACYGWFYHMMVRDEAYFEKLSSLHLESVESYADAFGESNEPFPR